MGFFTIDRELLTHDLWLEKPFSRGQAWVDLIGLANHCDTKLMVRGKSIEAKRGEVNRSFRWLADRWGWSRTKVNNFISFLEEQGMVSHETRQGETVLTLCNYCVWQDKYLSKEPQESHSRATGKPQESHEQQYKQYKQDNPIQENNKKGAVYERWNTDFLHNIEIDADIEFKNLKKKLLGE
jgi:hypothetical protein